MWSAHNACFYVKRIKPRDPKDEAESPEILWHLLSSQQLEKGILAILHLEILAVLLIGPQKVPLKIKLLSWTHLEEKHFSWPM